MIFDLGTFWGAIAEDIAAAEPPTGFQGITSYIKHSPAFDLQLIRGTRTNNLLVQSLIAGLISWLFLPAVAAGMYFDVPVM